MAFTVEFGPAITPAALHAVGALDAAIANAMAAGALPGVVETMPTFRSLTVFYDPLATSRAVLQPVVQALLDSADGALAAPVQHWRLPICHEGDCGPDLADTAAAAGLQVDDVVALHSATRLQVYMLGFLPGFPFMGDLPAALQRPRRTQPRVRVPAGSVSVANQLCAIYPWESPGGWHLLGRCPVPLFDARRPVPALLAPGGRCPPCWRPATGCSSSPCPGPSSSACRRPRKAVTSTPPSGVRLADDRTAATGSAGPWCPCRAAGCRSPRSAPRGRALGRCARPAPDAPGQCAGRSAAAGGGDRGGGWRPAAGSAPGPGARGRGR